MADFDAARDFILTVLSRTLILLVRLWSVAIERSMRQESKPPYDTWKKDVWVGSIESPYGPRPLRSACPKDQTFCMDRYHGPGDRVRVITYALRTVRDTEVHHNLNHILLALIFKSEAPL